MEGMSGIWYTTQTHCIDSSPAMKRHMWQNAWTANISQCTSTKSLVKSCTRAKDANELYTDWIQKRVSGLSLIMLLLKTILVSEFTRTIDSSVKLVLGLCMLLLKANLVSESTRTTDSSVKLVIGLWWQLVSGSWFQDLKCGITVIPPLPCSNNHACAVDPGLMPCVPGV